MKYIKLNNICLIASTLIVSYYNIWLGLAMGVFFIISIKNQTIEKQKYEEKMDSYVETFNMTMDYKTRQSISNLNLPLCMCNTEGIIVWYNKRFSELVGKKGLFGDKINEHFFEIEIATILSDSQGNFDLERKGDKSYKAIYTINKAKEEKDNTIMIYFQDTTELENMRLLHELGKPVVITAHVDSFDEVLDSTEEKNRPQLEAEIESSMKAWALEHKLAIRKISKDKYFLVTTEEELVKMEDERFSILDNIRSIDIKNFIPISISMGVSSFVNSLRETQLISNSALDIALGRGGDQVAVKKNDKYVFYGGKSKAVEKKTRVKARIIGYALRDLFLESKNVLVMGHQFADLDSLGSALGVVAIAEMLGKEAKIVIETPNSSIDVLYERIKSSDKYKNVFLKKDEAMRYATEDTLLVVVDTHNPKFTEYPKLVDKSERIVVIDHHRRGPEFIDKAVLVYHETYASSTSEMVTELVQYIKERPQLNPQVAEALLSGITLDTKNFTFKTGVRTFEAAAFLRKYGADTIAVKTLFQGDMESFIVRAEALNKVRIIGEKIALTYCPKTMDNPQLIASQIADELLNLKGIQASFVIASSRNNEVQISARSLGEINVQVIMEKLGGGGHIETAGTQIKDTTIEEALEKVEEQIKLHLKEEEK
ncbi:MAG: DHH family phosphoesterase [Proteocatella sp.]